MESSDEATQLREIIKSKDRTIRLLCDHCTFIKSSFELILKSIYETSSDKSVRDAAQKLDDRLKQTDFELL